MAHPSDSRLVQYGDRLPVREKGVLPLLGRLVLKLFDWRVTGTLPNTEKAVLIIAPHTSNWDGLFGLSAIQALELKVHAIGKHSLFVGPLGWLLRSIGVIPVNRESAQGLVEQIAEAYAARERLWLAIAPEGTRKSAARWHLGFYHLAKRCQLPIIAVAFDYRRREVRVLETFWPTDDEAADLQHLYSLYTDATPKRLAGLSRPLREIYRGDQA